MDADAETESLEPEARLGDSDPVLGDAEGPRLVGAECVAIVDAVRRTGASTDVEVVQLPVTDMTRHGANFNKSVFDGSNFFFFDIKQMNIPDNARPSF